MDEHLGARVVCVVSDDAPSLQRFLLPVNHLQQLGCFGPRGRAHVQHDVARLHVEEERRQHRHQFLPGDQSRVETLLQVFVEVVEHLALLENLLGCVDLVKHMSRVPGKYLQARHFLGLVLAFSFSFALLQHGLHEIGVLDLAPEGGEVGAAWVYSEDNGQFFFHGGPEEFELLCW